MLSAYMSSKPGCEIIWLELITFMRIEMANDHIDLKIKCGFNQCNISSTR